MKLDKYKYLKNGAMYSLFFLGVVMLLQVFGVHMAEWVSPVVVIFIILSSLYISRNKTGKEEYVII